MSLLEDEIHYEFTNRSRWDNVSFSEHNTRYDIANFDDDFTIEKLSTFEDKGKSYIEYLKCYLKVITDGDFYPEVILDEYEFIKSKCEQFGFMDSFEKYYKGT